MNTEQWTPEDDTAFRNEAAWQRRQWTQADDLARRIDAVETAIREAKLREDRRGLIVGARIALAITAAGWAFIGTALWLALRG